jgi:hypothetical protein
MGQRPEQLEPPQLVREREFGHRCVSHRHSRQVDLPSADPGDVPPGSPSWVTSDLIADTIRVWQPYYRTPLTSADALEMIMNVGQLFEVLFEGRQG